MEFKDKSYLVKLSFLGFFIGLFALLLFNIEVTVMLGVLLSTGSWIPIAFTRFLFPQISYDAITGIGVWLTPIIYFLYGAIIGFIIDKFKN